MNEAFSKSKILIFDLDDTLVITDAKIRVCDARTGECHELTPEEFNGYQKNKNHILNFDDFKSLEIMKAGRMIQTQLDILEKNYKRGNAIGVITARDDQDMVYTWLKEHVGFHVKREFIWAINDPKMRLNGTIAEKKKEAMRWFIEQGYVDITFFDDDVNNINLIKELAKELGDSVKIKANLVKHPH
jgi:hypothetical protein